MLRSRRIKIRTASLSPRLTTLKVVQQIAAILHKPQINGDTSRAERFLKQYPATLVVFSGQDDRQTSVFH
jgi:hypothetical protein